MRCELGPGPRGTGPDRAGLTPLPPDSGQECQGCGPGRNRGGVPPPRARAGETGAARDGPLPAAVSSSSQNERNPQSPRAPSRGAGGGSRGARECGLPDRQTPVFEGQDSNGGAPQVNRAIWSRAEKGPPAGLPGASPVGILPGRGPHRPAGKARKLRRRMALDVVSLQSVRAGCAGWLCGLAVRAGRAGWAGRRPIYKSSPSSEAIS